MMAWLNAFFQTRTMSRSPASQACERDTAADNRPALHSRVPGAGDCATCEAHSRKTGNEPVPGRSRRSANAVEQRMQARLDDCTNRARYCFAHPAACGMNQRGAAAPHTLPPASDGERGRPISALAFGIGDTGNTALIWPVPDDGKNGGTTSTPRS